MSDMYSDSWFVPPLHIRIKGRHQLKNWYKHWAGHMPDGWQDGESAIQLKLSWSDERIGQAIRDKKIELVKEEDLED